MAYKEFYDRKEDVPRNWGYQSIAPSQAYRDGYDAIRWDADFKLHLNLSEEQVVGCSVALLQVIRANKLDFLDCSDVKRKPVKKCK